MVYYKTGQVHFYITEGPWEVTVPSIHELIPLSWERFMWGGSGGHTSFTFNSLDRLYRMQNEILSIFKFKWKQFLLCE